MSNKLDLMACWNDVRTLLSGHREAVLAVAGVFHFFPALAVGFLVPQPVVEKATDFNGALAIMLDYMAANMPWLMAASLLAMAGSLSILTGVMRTGRPTVGASILLALTLLPAYFLGSVLSGLAIAAGLFVMLLPGVFLAIKFSLLAPIAAAEGPVGALTLLRRSWQLTSGNTLRIGLFFAVILLVGWIGMAVVGALAGVAAALLLPAEGAFIARVTIDSLAGTVLSVVLLLGSAALYRQLRG